ncbi:MAG TPA: glycosyltransferase family 87 protein, partial [Blastocatellia bacterium]|nr:glycosyltransferase family 87 protein [Blastocatellia bacterium]
MQAQIFQRGLAVALVVLIAIGTGMLWLYWWGRDLHRFTQWITAYIGLYIGQFGMYAVACWVALKWRKPSSRAVEWLRIGIIIFFAVAFRATLVPERPYLSSDVYRYVWDGHLQAQGINPYVYLPDAPELVPLRDEERFPDMVKIYPNMSWLHLPTPYPPAAQAIYLLVYLIHPLNVTAFKAATLAFDLLTILALMWALGRARLDPAQAIIFAWHPLVIFEGAHSGHIESAFMTMFAFALVAWVYKKHALTGIALALATLIKFYPALVLPVFLRSTETSNDSRDEASSTWIGKIRSSLLNKANLTMLGSFAITIALVYLPYALSGKSGIGSLANEFHEEGFTGKGVRYFLLAMVHEVIPLSTNAYLVLGAVLLSAFALWWAIREKRDVVDVARGAATLITVYLILSSPHYAWHYAWLLPFLCFAPRLGWIYLAGASVFMYLLWYVPTVYPDMPIWLGLAMFVPGVALLFWEKWKRENSTASDSERVA